MVGSSSTSNSTGGSASSTRASATRNRSPPDRAPTRRSVTSPRSRNRASRARISWGGADGQPRVMHSSTGRSSSSSRRWSRKPIRPEVASCTIRPSRVDFPTPLSPTSPSRIPPVTWMVWLEPTSSASSLPCVDLSSGRSTLIRCSRRTDFSAVRSASRASSTFRAASLFARLRRPSALDLDSGSDSRGPCRMVVNR